MEDRFDINILDENNWQIEDTETGEYANPVDGVTNVLKGLVKTMNNYEKKVKELTKENKELEQIIQDESDSVSNWFINYWDTLTEEAKSDAHLELGIDIDYEE